MQVYFALRNLGNENSYLHHRKIRELLHTLQNDFENDSE